VALAANTNLLDGGVSTVKGAPAQAAAVVTTNAASGAQGGNGKQVNTKNGSCSSDCQTTAGITAEEAQRLGLLTTDDPALDPSVDTTIPTSGSAETTYTVPGIGDVTVNVTDGVLTIAGVSEASGWTYTVETGSHNGGYEVVFTNANSGAAYEFHVALLDGRIVTSIRDVTSQPTEPRPPSYDDDDDDQGNYEDHDEDEDHENHEDGEDHEVENDD
jgi:hypothetical protein